MAQDRTAAVVVAAGRGERFGGGVPKQFLPINGVPILGHSINAILSHPAIDGCVVVLNETDMDLYRERVEPTLLAPVMVTHGGPTRAISCLRGLTGLQPLAPDHVLIHDGARPFLSPRLIDRLLGALDRGVAAIPALPSTDALWITEGDRLIDGLARDTVVRAQTPQAFRFRDILAAHRSGHDQASDDAATAIAAGLPVVVVEGEETNVKITTRSDMPRNDTSPQALSNLRCGQGYDVHRFGPGEGVTLCGVTIPFRHALTGHSDADVAMHAITDALYGALAEGDIGRWFDPSDARWKDADSALFLRHARDKVGERGYMILSIDCTLICEEPKISPHATRMRQTIASLLAIDVDRVSVKATTSEGLGFTGRQEGIAALALATLAKG